MHIISLTIFCARILRVTLCILFNNLKAYYFGVNAFNLIYSREKGVCHLAIKKCHFLFYCTTQCRKETSCTVEVL